MLLNALRLACNYRYEDGVAPSLKLPSKRCGTSAGSETGPSD